MTLRCVRCKREIDRSFKACPHCGEPVTEFLRRYADEPVDGKYQLVERLGAGGMGEVYKVNHTFLGTTRVIKVIRPQISESADAHDRFLREARAATKIQHPNVATLHDFSALPDGSHYMVWEYIDGENLAQRIRARGTLQPRYAVGLTIQALQGLEAIHRAGIVHRDISPENIMITRDSSGQERVKIIDLGVAKVEDSGDQAATRAGVFVGKLRYASPEHLGFLSEGEKIDGRADLYSMGMVLYEMLTGRPPFEASTPHEYVLMHSRDTQFKPLDIASRVPGGEALQAAITKALERDRHKRFSSAKEFAAALEDVEKSLPDPNAVRTMATLRPDAEETLRQTTLPDTLHRQTERSAVAPVLAPETIRTPLPSTAEPKTVVAPAQRKGGTAGLFIAAGLIVAALGVTGFMLLRRTSTSAPPPTTAQSSTAPASPAVASRTTVDVVPPPDTASTNSIAPLTAAPATTTTTTPSPELSQPAVPAPTATVAPERPRPTVAAEKQKPAEAPRETVPAAVVNVRTFVDGGDSDSNDIALGDLRQQLQGVTRMAVRGGNAEMLKELTERLKSEAPSISIGDTAEVVVDFRGNLEHLGRGRKRRSAEATVLKNGRPVFKYELHPEEYRVGDTPAEAFARVLLEALR